MGLDIGTAANVLIMIAGSVGGYYSGRRASALQSEVISALQIRVDDLKDTVKIIPDLNAEIAILRGLVTQRANVEAVIEIVTRTEEKLDELAGVVHGQSNGGRQ